MVRAVRIARRVVGPALIGAAVAAILVPASLSGAGRQAGAAAPGGDAAIGAGVFLRAGCASCHSLAVLGATADVGPSLDDLEPTFDTVVNIVTYGAGPAMPAFGSRLAKREIRDLAAFVAAASRDEPVALLPDLDVVRPRQIGVRRVSTPAGRRFELGFLSATENVGPGPLAIHGRRSSTSVPEMTVDQLVSVSNGTTRSNAEVAVMWYGLEVTHGHWHLRPFMVYELRRAKNQKLVREGMKMGFCLGDRYRAPLERARRLFLPNAPAKAVFTGDCGHDEPGLLEVEQGTSPGWGGIYLPYVDGQSIDITGLPAGRYLLVHRVNPERLLEESSYSNNASSALVSISWPDGASRSPRVKVLAACSASERCSAPQK